VMLLIVVEVAGTVCDADCSIFSQTVDRKLAERDVINPSIGNESVPKIII